VSLLRDSISSIGELIDEAHFKITKDGISLLASDRAMVAVVDFQISSKAFEKYEVGEDQSVGLNITNLMTVLKRAGTNDKLTLKLKEDKLEIIIEGQSRRRFVVPLIELREEEIPPIDQLEFTSKVKISPSVLQNGISDAEVIGDSVIFDVNPNRFGMLAEGDVSMAELQLEKGNEALMELATGDGSVRARYALDYLKKMVKAAKIADTVSIEYGQDYPMRMSFTVSDKLKLNFIIAPRVTESD
jgi:proliferating cell nuclear antigen